MHKQLTIFTKVTIIDPAKRKAAISFLKKKNFHQTLRNEILFAIAPRTLTSGVVQQNSVLGVMNSLLRGGFLRDEGFKQLGTIIELIKIIGFDLKFALKSSRIGVFSQTGNFLAS